MSQDLFYFTIGVTLIIMMSMTLLVIVLLIFQRKRLKYKIGIERLEAEHAINLLKTKLETQENSFLKISREIHDNIGQKLSLVKILINAKVGSGLPLDNETLSEISKIITESLEDLRDISRSLNSDLIATNGLVSALQHHIGQLNSLGRHNFKLTVTGESDQIDPQAELAVFRIVQEALNNVVKHASATQVHVEVYYGSDHLGIAITDNGCGFDPSTTASGNGLTNMKSRVQALQGDFTITSTPDTGTRIQIKIPKHV